MEDWVALNAYLDITMETFRYYVVTSVRIITTGVCLDGITMSAVSINFTDGASVC